MRRFHYEAQLAQQRSWAESISQPGQNVEGIAFSVVLSEHNPKSRVFSHNYSTQRNSSIEISVCVIAVFLKVSQE